MTPDELRQKFEENVQYLQRNIPPDDIYVFAEQTYMASLFFLHKWSKCVDITAECKADETASKWVRNIMALLEARDKGIDINLDLDLKSLEEYEEDFS